MARPGRLSRRLIQVLVGTWVASVIASVVLIYAGSWQWTAVALSYLFVTLVIAGFVQATSGRNEDQPR
jgi:uncharacterized membrane protein YccC